MPEKNPRTFDAMLEAAFDAGAEHNHAPWTEPNYKTWRAGFLPEQDAPQ